MIRRILADFLFTSDRLSKKITNSSNLGLVLTYRGINFVKNKFRTDMKKQMLSIVFVGLTTSLWATGDQAEVLTIEGQYQSKNLFVSNAMATNGVGFCAYEVRVNGEVTTDAVSSSAFEIDLEQYRFKQGDDLIVQIVHKKGCQPKVLNPTSLSPQATFKTKAITLDETGLISWTTTSESGSLAYVVEQYKWNKWVKIGEVQGTGTAGENNYSFKMVLTSGKNKVRVKQVGNSGKEVYSPAAEVMSNEVKPTMDFDKKSKAVKFSSQTNYEIYDKYGQLCKKGFGDKVDLSTLKKENYYLNYDNTFEEVKMK